MRNTRAVGALLWLLVLGLPFSTEAQVVGEEAELTRLRAKAEEAIANDDPDGAAMAMGRAALMAGQLAKRRTGEDAQLLKATEALFRSQEHVYRAMALFRRAGGQLPASSGVCGSLALAQTSLRHAVELAPKASLRDALYQEAARLRESAENWGTVVDSMIAEYQCL